MARQTIQRGSAANDGTGDSLRNAAQKINDNFKELWEKLGGDSVNMSSTIQLENIAGYDAISFEGLTVDGTNKTYLFATDPTTLRLVTLPDASGTVVLTENAAVLSSKTLNNPKIVSFILDSSDNELIDFDAVASAVNHVGISNAISTVGPTIQAVGADSDIDLNINGKGDGSVNMGRMSFNSQTITTNGTAIDLTQPFVRFNKTAGDLTGITCSDGDTLGEILRMVNTTANTVAVTPATFGQGTSFTIKARGHVDLSWAGDGWYLNQDSGNYVSIT